MKSLRLLEPLTKSGYVRITLLLVGLYFAVNSLTGRKSLNEAVLLEDLRETAQQLGKLSASGPPPQTLMSLNHRGVISNDLLERCEQANVTYHPENLQNRDGQPVFTVPAEGRMNMVTDEGLIWRRSQ